MTDEAVAVTDEAAILAYSVTPGHVPHGAGPDHPSEVTIQLAVNNPRDEHRQVSQLQFRLPVGTDAGSLTSQPATIRPSPAGVAWAIDSDGQGLLTAMPQPPYDGLDRHEAVAFTIDGLRINDQPGLAGIEVFEYTDRCRSYRLDVAKTPPGLAITRFTATPVTVEADGRTTFQWVTTGAARVSLSWPGGSLDNLPGQGRQEVIVERTTTYTLTAEGGGTTVYAQHTVSVPTLQIYSFGASKTHVARSEETVLSWRVLSATGVFLEPGCLPVEPAGSRPVRPEVETTYELRAVRQNQQLSSNLRVYVEPVVVDRFEVEPRYVPPGGGLPVTLSWGTRWATAVRLTPPEGRTVPLSGTATECPATITTYQLTAEGLDPRSVNRTVTVAPAVTSLGIKVAPDALTISWQAIGRQIRIFTDNREIPCPRLTGSSTMPWPWPTSILLRCVGDTDPQSVLRMSVSPERIRITVRLAIECPYGINAAGATGTVACSAAADVGGAIVAEQPVTFDGTVRPLDFALGHGTGPGVLWDLTLQQAGRQILGLTSCLPEPQKGDLS